jgi:PEP-CTERM motif
MAEPARTKQHIGVLIVGMITHDSAKGGEEIGSLIRSLPRSLAPVMKKSLIRQSALLLLVTTSAFAPSASAGVAVGSSSLIQALDYSDTFTFGSGASGTRNGVAYNAGAFPITDAPRLALESNYGNTARSWTGSLWSLNNDANFLNGTIVYPGGSGAGSVSGFTQTGGGVDFGIEYDLRNDFVVQFDAVQVSDRIDITIGNFRDAMPGMPSAGANGLSIFFRTNGFTNLGSPAEVGIWNPAIGEALTTFDTGLSGVDLAEWHNYAVRFNLNTLELAIFVDEIALGVIDLNTFGGPKWGGGVVAPGAYASVVNAATNDAVSVGASGGNRVWTDNFQVGQAVPEPGSAAMLMLGLGALGLRRRR